MIDHQRHRCIHQLFEEKAAQSPDAAAVSQKGRDLSYGELNARANQLAHELRRLDVKRGTRVATLLPRSIELVVAELAILKCGAAYVPLDENTPAARQAFFIDDSDARWLVTEKGRQVPARHRVGRVDLDEGWASSGEVSDLNEPISPGEAAYLMYTSGSTGRPKGIVIPHRAVTTLVSANRFARFDSGERVAFLANPAFDPSTMEVWGPLLNGGQIIVIDQATLLVPERLQAVLEEADVTVLHMTAGLFGKYANVISDVFAQMHYLVLGGDIVDRRAVEHVMRSARPRHLVHTYGPTETTLWATSWEVEDVPTGTDRLPIGRAIGQTSVYVLDARGAPVPPGSVGEIHIAGAGIAHGYWNRPTLTAECFLPDPFCEQLGERMYKTGDLGRSRADGNIEFVGRNDSQVKIRGFRIEPGEVEARLLEHHAICEAVVVARGTGDDRSLIAYYTTWPGGGPVKIDQLRSHMLDRLPEHMVPKAYLWQDAFPLTPNGKLDRSALMSASPGNEHPSESLETGDTAGSEGAADGVSPSRRWTAEELEALIARIWCKVHVVAHAGHDRHFFGELGGSSISIMRIAAQLSEEIGADVPLTFFFQHPTIRELARAMSEPESRDGAMHEERASLRSVALRDAVKRRTRA